MSVTASGGEATIRTLFPELDKIRDRSLADKVVQVWVRVWEESGWTDLRDVPKNERIKDVSLVQHVRGVTQAARKLAEIALDLYPGVSIDLDVLTAGALLHDASKPLESKPEGKTPAGKLLPHGYLAAHLALAAGLPYEIVHIILTHSKNSSAVPPKTYEGLIVHYADYCDSDVLNIRFGHKLLLTYP